VAENSIRNSVSGEQLRALIERYERLDAEKKGLSEDQKLVMQEAKSAGFDTKIIKYCIKVRAMKPSDYQEGQALADMYLTALGMVVDPPLFRAANRINVDIAAKESVIEALKNFVPENGSITIQAGGASVRLTRDKSGDILATDIVNKASEPRGFEQAPVKQKAPPPDVDLDGAFELGKQAAKDDLPIIKNPFPFADARRAKFDAGWRAQAGNDGFGE
jgi:uncharacterized protein (UPF0335 family)